MLEFLRKSAGSWVIKILLMLIVVAFVLMGAGSFYAQRSVSVASVNGESISVQEYQRAYYNITANLRNQFGGNLNDDILKMFNVQKQAIDSLIDKTLLLQVARENDMRVTDKSLVDSITETPMFQRNGAFDPQVYKMVLGQNRLSPPDYEEMQKEALLTEKVRNFVSNTIMVSDAEARAWYEWENSSVSIDYVAFSPTDFAGIAVSDEEIQAYYDAHKADYKADPGVKSRYVQFSPEKYIANVDVRKESIENYYNEHPSEFKSPETVSARHILLRTPENASPEIVEEKRKLALDIMEKAKGGEDFATLAKQYSEDPGSKENGGELGMFTREKMVQPFSEKAFSMDPGQISEPVRTQFGWHLIKVETRNPESVKPLEAAEAEIRNKLAAQEAKSIAYDKAGALYDISYDGNDLVQNAQDLGLEITTTDFFTRDAGPEGIKDVAGFVAVAFELPLMEISDIKEIGGVYYLIQVIEKEEAKVPELDTIKDKVIADARTEKQARAAAEAANDLLVKAKAANSLGDAVGESGKVVKSTGFFTRNDPIPVIGRAQEITAAAFLLSAQKPLADQVVVSQGAHYVIAFKEKKVPEPSAYEKDKDRTMSQLVTRKRQQTYDSWLKNMRENSEIQISDRLSE